LVGIHVSQHAACCLPAKHHLRPPERQQGAERTGNVAVRDRAHAPEARPVAYSHLSNRQPELARPSKHLGIDEKAPGLRQQAQERITAVYLEGAIYVANRGTEQRAHQPIVAARVEPPQPRILPPDAITNDNWTSLSQRQQPGKIGEMELAVRVRERHKFAARRFKTGSQRRPVPAVDRVPQKVHTRPVSARITHCLRCAIATAIVHD
jgi:hypothetical protein